LRHPGRTRAFPDRRPSARETVEWQPAAYAHLSLIVGPDWAEYHGRYLWSWTPGDPLFAVVALIDGRDCGVQNNPLQGEGPEWSYGMRALPDELRPGCGRPGSLVHFELRAGDVALARARETAIWQPAALRELDLTFTPVSVLPATGDGTAGARLARSHLALAVVAAGLACVVAGACVRRRSGALASVKRRANERLMH
jgi:hypothetical protein